jgi:hypothetical protein
MKNMNKQINPHKSINPNFLKRFRTFISDLISAISGAIPF